MRLCVEVRIHVLCRAAKALASESFKATAPELHVIVRNYVREITGATA